MRPEFGVGRKLYWLLSILLKFNWKGNKINSSIISKQIKFPIYPPIFVAATF